MSDYTVWEGKLPYARAVVLRAFPLYDSFAAEDEAREPARNGVFQKGADMGHNRDKEKKEGKKKARHDLKEKRKLKKEKKQTKSPFTMPGPK